MNKLEGKAFPARLVRYDEVGGWASEKGMSINAAVNFMIGDFLDREASEVSRLRAEVEELREKLVAVAISRCPAVNPLGAIDVSKIKI